LEGCCILCERGPCMLDPPTFSRREKLVSVKRSHSGAVHGAASLPPTYHSLDATSGSVESHLADVGNAICSGGESPSETPQLPHSRSALSITEQPREAQLPLSIAPPCAYTHPPSLSLFVVRELTLLEPHDSRTCSRLHSGLCINTATASPQLLYRSVSFPSPY
jgi:hypothetical protein